VTDHGASGVSFERKDPVTGKVATRSAAATQADVDRGVAAAAKAFEIWLETGPTERRSLLLNAADLVESRTADFVKLMLEETGATAPWACFNVHLAAGILREAAALTTQITGEVIPSDKPGILSLTVRQPVGVVLGIGAMERAGDPCGPRDDAGFPKGVVNVIRQPGRVSRASAASAGLPVPISTLSCVAAASRTSLLAAFLPIAASNRRCVPPTKRATTS
jgi:Aldehyde dehydrogenase family